MFKGDGKEAAKRLALWVATRIREPSDWLIRQIHSSAYSGKNNILDTSLPSPLPHKKYFRKSSMTVP